ncbi:hypothetical protein X956_08535 [Trueperella pyogenes TP8]|nr:hypothetical protein X956_08535 [Trueperella pyogenes TP8]
MDNLEHAGEVAGAGGTFQDRCHGPWIDTHEWFARVHVLIRGQVGHVDALALKESQVLLFRARVGGIILVGAKLQRIDVHRGHHRLRCCARRFQQLCMPIVQSTHSHHEGASATGFLQGARKFTACPTNLHGLYPIRLLFSGVQRR